MLAHLRVPQTTALSWVGLWSQAVAAAELAIILASSNSAQCMSAGLLGGLAVARSIACPVKHEMCRSVRAARLRI